MRCGVVGLNRGRQFVALLERVAGCRVVAVCNPSGRGFDGLRERLACHTAYERFLDEDLDAVAILSPGPVHAEQSIAALDRGVHVLCETPCVYSLAEARAVTAAARRGNATFMLAENYLWLGWYPALAERAGMIGEVLYAEGDYTHDCRDFMLRAETHPVPYRERAQHPGATRTWRATDLPPLCYSSHTLGPLLTFMRDRVTTCFGRAVGSRTAPELGTIDLEAALLTTEKGAVIRLTNGFTVAHPMALHYKIEGTTGSFLLQRFGTTTSFFYSDLSTPGHEAESGDWQPLEIPFAERRDGREATAAMVGDWVAALERGAGPPIGLQASLDMVVPGVLAHLSAERGGEVMAVPSSYA